MTAANQSTEERRKSARRRCLLGGRILYDDRIRTLDCRLLNFSDGGALLRTEAVDILPAAFGLAVDARGMTYRARVRWRSPGRFGVELRLVDEA
jgi:hypothetical protein